jgi:hypothetical protein
VERSTVFLLDLISNSLGAMLLLFFVVVSKRAEPPPARSAETLTVTVTAGDPRAAVRFWVQPPGSERSYWCEPSAPSRPDLADMDRDPLAFSAAEADTEAAVSLGGAVPGRSLARSLWARPMAEDGRLDRHTCTVLVHRPRLGEWRYRAYVADDPSLSGIQLAVEAWFAGRRWIRDGSNSARAVEEPEGDPTFRLEIPKVHATDGPAGTLVLSSQPRLQLDSTADGRSSS